MLTLLILIQFIFLTIRLAVAGYNYFSAPFLPVQRLTTAPKISVLIPARNEAHNIAHLLDSLLAGNQPIYEILILDDHSTDQTRQIVEAYSGIDSRIKIWSGKTLPEGWTGKNFACHQLGQAAMGDYLLFIDADVVVKPTLIESAVQRMMDKKLSLLTLFCKQRTPSIGEKITVPLMNYLLLTLLPLRLIERHPFPIFSAACGQFMLFDKNSYANHEWHQEVRGIIAEDLAIMKILKKSGEKGEGLLCGGQMNCRMYTGFQSAVNGFSKNFIAPFDNSIALFLLFIVTVIFGPLAVIMTSNFALILLMVLMIIATRYFTAKLAGEPLWEILLHPIQMMSLGYIALMSIYRKLNRSVEWKGRSLSVQPKQPISETAV